LGANTKPSASASSAVASSASSSLVMPQIFTNIAGARFSFARLSFENPAAHGRNRELADECGRVVAADERLADENSVESGRGDAPGIVGGTDRRFRDRDHVGWDQDGERGGRSEILDERRQVAAVHADDARTGAPRPVNLGRVVRLHE